MVVNKITKDLVIKSLTIGAVASCLVMIKGMFSSDKQDFITVDLNKMLED